ncbi:uncharacterized protein LOC113273758 [Papaver somniferum]|uniref:uncharacterized protein LOC113273758 n=1 Tax=Papaver somniferum TaxID=3469 RepID=UPI000E6FD3B1|nr:uncharacterized protein LOC113273758 [Papaver somniferum]
MGLSGSSNWVMFRVQASTQYSSGSNTANYRKHEQPKPLVPEMKWLRHQTSVIVTLAGTTANYGTVGGTPFIISCSAGSDIILWNGKSGKNLGSTDKNELKNSMARISPNGRLIVAAAASSVDVKIWEIILTKA